ncbi:hypothetical protein HPP92_003650 [Vanilla planifolia]|uniref:Uncharacterized protein n=1 Tax=Vanilla planifolia TaxID=51239 RepID=A0A835S0D5_VANPL|nr:hypothetical protein HPP92_003650 [Vanilla planifolia]
MASQLASSPSLAFRDISFTSTHRGSLRLFPERSSNHCLLILRHPSARRSCSAVVFSRRRKSPAFVGQTKISKSKVTEFNNYVFLLHLLWLTSAETFHAAFTNILLGVAILLGLFGNSS